MSPRTSIIMPVYNTEKSVIRSIESVLKQTDSNFELIIINDQSPDNSHTIIQNFIKEKDDNRIKYLINEKNMGLAGTRNIGIEHASGEWLAYIDSDDAYKPHFLETMHNAVTKEVDVVVCSHETVSPDGSLQQRPAGQPSTLTGHDAMLKLMNDHLTPFAWDKIFRKSTMGDLKFPIVNRTEDAGYSIPAFQRSRKVRIIEDSLHLYSVNPQSITWGSVPPTKEMYKFMKYLETITGTNNGNRSEKNAFSTSWSITFLNGAQAALRLQPDNISEYLRECQKALSPRIIIRTWQARPLYAAAGTLLKISPTLYRALYGAYIKRTYGL